LYNIIFRCFSIAIRTYRTLKNSSFEIIHQKRRRVISNADNFRDGLMNYKDTTVKCCHLNILACKGILGQVFIRVYRLKIWTVMLVFWSSFVNCCPSNLSGSTIPPPSLPCVNKYTVQCKLGGGGSGQINTCRKVPLRVFRWQHFALPSMSLIFLRVQPTAAAPAGGATPTAGEQQPFIRMFEPNFLTQEAHQWEQSSAGSTGGEGAQDVAWRSSLRILGPQDYTVRQGQRENVWEVWVAHCPQQDEGEVLLEILAELLFVFTKIK
jgi:hypothetical protein